MSGSILHNKKAIVAKPTELVMVTIAFVILCIIGLIFIGMAELRVDGKLAAMNAHLTCSNNLMSFTKLESSSGQPMEELLIGSYVNYTQKKLTGQNDSSAFEEFSKESKTMLDGLLGDGEWTLSVSDAGGKLLELGKAHLKHEVESCSIALPLPCAEDSSNCLLIVGMNTPIQK